MWRKVLGLLWLGALSACTQPVRFCEQDGDCQQAGAVCQQNVCVNDGETSSTLCPRACADYQVCLAKSLECVPRFSGLEVTPKNETVVGGGEVFVQAELRLAGNYEPKFPSELRLRVVRSGTGEAMESPMAQESAGAGRYLARWTPSGAGDYQLTVSYPEAQVSSGPVKLTVDTTGPVLTVSLPARSDGGTPDSGFIYADPSATGAWRRDQRVAVRVESNATDLDTQSLRVRVSGFDGGVSLSGLTLTQAPCDAGYCGTVDVPLWQPGLPAFRGSFAVEVSARDRVGNEGTGAGSIPVTRWKWRYDIKNATVTAAPAVGNKGVLYVGTTNGGNSDGRLFAIADDGRVLWEATTGAVVSSPSVGNALPAGSDRVYAAHKKGSTSRVGFYTDNSTFNPLCPDTSGSALIQSGLAIGQVSTGGGSALETVYGIYSGRSGGTIFALRPDAEDDSQLRCPTSPGVGDVVAPSTMLASGSSAVFGSSTGHLKSYTLASTGVWNGSAQWDRTLGLANPTALAAVGGGILGGSNDGSASRVFVASLDGGQNPTTISTSSPAWNTSVGGGAAAKGVVGLNANKLLTLSVGDGGTASIEVPSDIVKSAPVWGSNSYVYTAGLISGSIQARRPLETVEWQLDTESPIEASMNLDCSRSSDGTVMSGMPGVLYAASQDGKVFAILVDSTGLDPSAPWPKYQHDSRNTGNPETPITSCP